MLPGLLAGLALATAAAGTDTPTRTCAERAEIGAGEPRCVTIELRVAGKRRTYRRTVPFGAIRC